MDEKKIITIWMKIAKASAELSHMAKDGREDFSKYDYLSAEKIVAETKKVLHANGLHAYASVTAVEELAVSAKGTFRQRTFMDVTIVDCVTGEKETVKVSSMGTDRGDKADGKASTYGFKYGLKRILMIESGEDDIDKSDPEDGGAPEDMERQSIYDRIAGHCRTLKYNAAKKVEMINRWGGDTKKMSIQTLAKMEAGLLIEIQKIAGGESSE